MGKLNYVVSAIYDTETTNIIKDKESRAFPCLFIVNDIRGIDLANYESPRDDNIKFFRVEYDMQEYIDKLVAWGEQANCIPIICAYNMMFDVKPLLFNLRQRYQIKVCAQSSTHVYTLDLLDVDGKTVLRFWDTFYLEMRGLAAMGETCGLDKAVGDWDYNLIRTQETPLSEQEQYYAGRDTQVIPAYLKYLLKANSWLKQQDFGLSVLTKTSLVRQMAKRKIGNIRINKNDGKQLTQTKAFESLCMKELPKSFKQYGLRKASFRGGLTFTSAKYAQTVVNNVASLDVTSMHHAFINGRYVPVNFHMASTRDLQIAFDSILNTSLSDVLNKYDKPFYYGIDALVEITNIRLKKDSCFDEWGIATIPSAKFRNRDAITDWDNARNMYNEELFRTSGFKDKAYKPTFAFGKLYSAEKLMIYVTEIELWALTRVYDWDSAMPIFGEISSNFTRPPDYVTLQSNLLFGMKTDVKTIIKHYKQGTKYTDEIPDTIPENIKYQLQQGALSEQFLNSYYVSTIKGMFNSIYGTMAQDIYKPDYEVLEDGELQIDDATAINEENWLTKQPKSCKVLYTYGSRIVGGSRLHLILAMEMMYKKLGNKIRITGGDTDSLKVSCDDDVSNDDLMLSLSRLHWAITNAIDNTQERVRDLYPNLVSTLKNIGCFDIESCGSTDRYKSHMEAWNKARISLDYDDKVHVTCAGLSRPSGKYTIEYFVKDMLRCNSIESVFTNVLGYNTYIYPMLSYALESHEPLATDIFDENIIDYLGNEAHVISHESNALYPVGRYLGEIDKEVNMSSVKYVKNKYGRDIDISEKLITMDENDNPCIYINNELYIQAAKTER